MKQPKCIEGRGIPHIFCPALPDFHANAFKHSQIKRGTVYILAALLVPDARCPIALFR